MLFSCAIIKNTPCILRSFHYHSVTNMLDHAGLTIFSLKKKNPNLTAMLPEIIKTGKLFQSSHLQRTMFSFVLCYSKRMKYSERY